MEMIAMLHKDVTKVNLFISILFLNHNRLVSLVLMSFRISISFK